MARVSGVKEKIHSPLYDAFFVPGARNGTSGRIFTEVMTDPRVIRFFVDVQNKTKLETNLQAAGVLPSLNTFEARAMRVVASTFSLPRTAMPMIRQAIIDAANTYRAQPDPITDAHETQLVNSIKAAFAGAIGAPSVNGHLRQAILNAANIYRDLTTEPSDTDRTTLVESIIDAFDAGYAAASGILSELIYNSVTTLLVGEKVMIEMPTFWFPAGAGVSPGNGTAVNHGEPDPMATFRFAEPVMIEPQQNFRVEMLFPQGLPGNLANVSGPLRIWVVLDGYLTRDVQ